MSHVFLLPTPLQKAKNMPNRPNLSANSLFDQRRNFHVHLDLKVSLSGVEGGGAGGESAPPKFWFVKNPGKISGNLGKISENPAKMAANIVWLKKWRPMFAEKQMKTFLGGHTKKSLHDLCGRKFVRKSHRTIFRASLGKLGQKSFAPLKICSLLHLW